MTPDDFQFFVNLIRTRSGVSIDEGKEYLVEARMLPLIEDMKLGSLSSLVASLRVGANESLENLVLHEMISKDTSFFRDIRTFDSLRDYVMPALIKKHQADQELHIWSAACSSGQEPYSIAMLLRESFPELAEWTVKIVATDISKATLARARQGSYSQLEVNRGLPPELLTKYFIRSGVRWQIKADIREMVEFRELNLLEPEMGFPKTDIVFIRNVLIYFDLELQQDTLAHVHDSMKRPSFLFLGGAETTLGVDARFERIDSLPRTGCYQLRHA